MNYPHKRDQIKPVPENPTRLRILQAFTLIELLVVISIIAVLAVLAMPSLSRAIETSRRSQCVSNLRQLVTGVLTYANDNNGSMPSEAAYMTMIAPYVGVSDKGPDIPNITKTGVFRCPSGWAAGASQSAHGGTYNYNYQLTPFILSGTNSLTAQPKLINFNHPSQTITFYCWWQFKWDLGNMNIRAAGPPSSTHTNGRPMGYLDGHVAVDADPANWKNSAPPFSTLSAY